MTACSKSLVVAVAPLLLAECIADSSSEPALG